MIIDLGIISALILIGKYIRVKFHLVQKFLIPPSVLAGVMGLILGPEVLGWLPFSDKLGTHLHLLRDQENFQRSRECGVIHREECFCSGGSEAF